jgi:hypothetical protein
VKDQKLRSDLYTAFVWAIFALGATQLASMSGGPVLFLIVMLFCGSIFTIFLVKAETRKSRSLKRMTYIGICSTCILFAVNGFFIWLVYLKFNFAAFVFANISVILFIIPLLISIPFLRQSHNVTK